MKELFEYAQGNPGALDFLMKVYMSPAVNLGQAAFIDSKIKSYKTLRGTNLYVLYSDLCDRNMDTVLHLLQKCPQNILEDACNRQDYSGRKLVANYIS